MQGASAEATIQDIIFAIALIVAFEGLLCAAFPTAMRRAMYEAAHMPTHLVRAIGLGAALIGVVALWLIKAA